VAYPARSLAGIARPEGRRQILSQPACPISSRNGTPGKKPPPVPPPPASPPRWAIHKAAHRLIWVGEVEAAAESEAIEKAAEQLGLLPAKLIAVRRRQCG